ncbi:hypothetical protein [Thauera sp.]|uniref:hypothetical protein n=1 Tax=Thauera sp. TaxID=1905334 RepID=UPI0039E37419
MHYLGLALYAEGRTDDRFLGPVLRRLCGEVCAASPYLVEFNDEVLILPDAPRLKHARRDERIVGAARQAKGAWSILFVHADADGDAVKARHERVQPALDRLRTEFDESCQGVAVIPVQAVEAWMLCDGDALRKVFGTTLDDSSLGLPSSFRALERLAEPKQCLEASFRASHAGGRRKRPHGVHERMSALGEQVALNCLRQLTAFQSLEAELKQALRALRILEET